MPVRSSRRPTRALFVVALATLCATGLSTHSGAAEFLLQSDSSAGPLVVSSVATGLKNPWSLAFLPDGRMLVSERGGQFRLISEGGRLSDPIAGVPKVQAQGQGGLLDVVLSPQFDTDQTLFFSFTQPTDAGARTAVARARLDAANLRLEDLEIIFAQQQDPSGRQHWGSRLVFAADGSLFITLGDRASYRDQAQQLDSHLGKIVRILPNGDVPQDNPFVGQASVLPEIWSYGHRNVQGAALHPETGVLWTHEHGPQGGDELNHGVAGANYGWPVITYGREYVIGTRIGEGETRPDVTAPAHYWVPSIAPSGMTFYTGNGFPAWEGNVFLGALKGEMLVRLVLNGDQVVQEERLLEDLGARIRDVRQGPDGLLYLLDESRGRLLRVSPSLR